MARVRNRNTRPEMLVRRLAHQFGYRFRLHKSDLPGKPDLAFPSRRKVIFVHGCFWHRHRDCRRASVPASNEEFWRRKLQKNADRDAAQLAALEALGWDALVVWECQTKDLGQLARTIRSFLGGRLPASVLPTHVKIKEIQDS